MELKTPLYARHVACGGKMVPFAGFLMPVQYKGVIEEHMAVRQQAGLFDVSHMGEVLLSGPDALANLNRLMTNDFTGMPDGKVRYSPMCNQSGGIVDDLIVYRMAQDRYYVVVNASNRHKDVDWMRGHLQGDVRLEDISDETAEIALQGPNSRAILEQLADPGKIPKGYYTFVERLAVAGVDCLVSRTGYTGELGYELYCPPDKAVGLWNALLEAGQEHGLVPCGLGARDTLRLEAAMPLYGHEMDDDISPLEVRLHFAVKLEKPDFIGKDALVAAGEPKRTRVGLRVTGRGIVREHCALYAGERQVGETTSGTHLPFLNGAYAMALVDSGHSQIGVQLEADVRGRRIGVEVVPLPFYKR